jgi:GNAT superfamily N-acetyltransferase
MTDLAHRGLVARAERLERAVTSVQKRFAPMFPGGEIQETGRAVWTMSATPLLVANGVIRYDAKDFDGPESERDLDSCLAVLSTYDVPWRFSAWEHLGDDRLIPHLSARGLVSTGRATALWLGIRNRMPAAVVEDRVEIRTSANASDHHLWTRIFMEVFRIPSRYAEVFELTMVDSHTFSAVAYEDNRPVGCVSFAIEDGVAVVENMGVLPSSRRRGIGGRMFEAAHAAAAARGAMACVVVANRAGSRICTQLGYQVATSVTHLVPAPPPA